MVNLFDKMLKDGESLFINEIALDFSFQPKEIPYRESEQHRMAEILRPLFDKRNARNMIVTGKPGIGKTAAARRVLRDLVEQTDDIHTIYVNCWQRNSSYKVALEICEQIDYRLTQNKRTDELLKMIVHNVNKKSAVFIFDEIDKVEEYDFLYTLLEEVFRKSVILITNFDEWIALLDERIRSRLMPETLEFNPYNGKEVEGIMRRRVEYAFVKGVWNEDAFQHIVETTVNIGDIRTGLYLLRATGLAAEDRSSRTIELQDAEVAISKLGDYQEKESQKLPDEEQVILKLAKESKECKIGDLFKTYQEKGGKLNYKSFQRKVRKLDEDKFISTKKIMGGKDGTTTIINFSEKKLTDF